MANGDYDNRPQRPYQVIVHATRQRGISRDMGIPWLLPSVTKFSKDLTLATSNRRNRNAVIMGRRTWETVFRARRPSRRRLFVVLSRRHAREIGHGNGPNMIACENLGAALLTLTVSPYDTTIENVFVLGGGDIFRQVLNAEGCKAIHLTEIEEDYECDTFIPAIDPSSFQPWYSSSPVVEGNIRYSFTTYVRVEDARAVTSLPKIIFDKNEERIFLSLVDEIVSKGLPKSDETGLQTLSKFGCQMSFNLRRSFPLLTTGDVSWRDVVEELLWFFSGSTDAKVLQKKGIHTWDGYASRQYLDGIGLTERKEGDLGPIYGFQWRHLGARYIDSDTDYSGQGLDQLAHIISTIKNNPDSKRIILSGWNPTDLKLMARAPSQIFAQFYVASGQLSCQVYEESANILRVPFCIASYALLTCIVSHLCGLLPGDMVYVIGDAHAYLSDVDLLKGWLENIPRPFPSLKISAQKTEIEALEEADIILVG